MKDPDPPPTKQNPFTDLNFGLERAAELQLKTELFLAVHRTINSAGHTDLDLCRILEANPDQVSDLLNGRIYSVSTDKLLRYAGRLGLKTGHQA